MRRPAATAILAPIVLAAVAGCGSSANQTAPPITATTAQTTTEAAPATTTPTPTVAQSTTVAAAVTTAAAATTVRTTTATPSTTPRTTSTSSSGVAHHAACPSEQPAGIQASFGRRRSAAAANKLVEAAGKVGFQGLVVQQRGCNGYAVVLPGLTSLAQAKQFRREARSAGFPVRLECRSHPVQGGLAAVFGHRPTRGEALQLRRQAERVGFIHLQVEQDACNDWEVDLYGLQTAAQRHELAKEAASVGFRLTFEPG